MSYDFYKVMHFLGIFMVFTALGGQFVHAINGGNAKQNRGRRWIGMFHGIGMILILLAGGGLLARLGVGFPPWAIIKTAIWIALGGIGALAARKKHLAGALWVVTIALGMLAAVVARTKPF